MNYSLNEDIFDLIFNRMKLWFIPIKENSYSPIFLNSKILLYFVVLILVFKILFVSISINFPKYIFFADVSKTDLVSLINKERAVLGLQTLSENSKLNQAALLKAKDMAYNQYFAHTSPNGISPWFWFKKIGYNYKYAGENLAIGFTESTDVYNAWFDSQSHRENFLNQNYSEVGTAVLNSNFGGNNTIIVVQLFGKQKTTSPAQVIEGKNVKPVLKSLPQNSKPIVIYQEGVNMAIEAENGKTIEITSKKVLSENINLPDDILTIKQDNNDGKNSLDLKFLNIAFYRSEEFIDKFIFWIYILVSVISVLNIIVNYKIQNRKLVLKSFFMVFVLYIGILVDKDLLIKMFLNI